jgi:hypothetical protein
MFVDVVSVHPLADHRLEIKFEDGVKGIVNIKELVQFTGVFEPLADEDEFAKVLIHEELGVVCWQNGADLDSDVLYSLVTGGSLPELDPISLTTS